MHEVAKALVNGDGVAQDFVLAAEWYEMAAAQGCIESRHRLGAMCYHGRGMEQDFARAVAEYRRAAEEGETLYTLALGRRALSAIAITTGAGLRRTTYRREHGSKRGSKDTLTHFAT